MENNDKYKELQPDSTHFPPGKYHLRFLRTIPIWVIGRESDAECRRERYIQHFLVAKLALQH